MERTEINSEFADKWKEEIDKNYQNLLTVSWKFLNEKVVASQAEWYIYAEKRIDEEREYLLQQYTTGTIVSVKMSKRQGTVLCPEEKIKQRHRTVPCPYRVIVTESGLLAACHLVGARRMSEALPTGAIAWDGNGVPAHKYMSSFGGYDISEVC